MRRAGNLSRGIDLENLKSKGLVKDIQFIKDHIHSTTGREGPYMVIETKEGVNVELPYETDDQGNITEEGYDKMNANLQVYIQGKTADTTAEARLRFEEGQKESQRKIRRGGSSLYSGGRNCG